MQVTILLIIQVVASFTIITLVLLQQGKGADMGSAFGSGSSGSLFGATGAANFLSRATKWAAVVFFIATIGLAYMSTQGLKSQNSGIMENFTNGNAVPTVPGMPSAPSSSGVPSSTGSPGASGVPAAPAAVPAPSVPVAPNSSAVPTAPAVPVVPK
jgi:preprotein translocase subunit SecG